MRPPRGRRVSRAEVAQRLEATEALMRDGHGRLEIVAELGRRFGISVRAADDYIARVRERRAAELVKGRATERKRSVARLRAF